MKKGQGLSLNMIAIAVITLVVIVVTIAVFTGIIGDIVPDIRGAAECRAQVNSKGCMDQAACENAGNTAVLGFGCPKDEHCCIEQK